MKCSSRHDCFLFTFGAAGLLAEGSGRGVAELGAVVVSVPAGVALSRGHALACTGKYVALARPDEEDQKSINMLEA